MAKIKNHTANNILATLLWFVLKYRLKHIVANNPGIAISCVKLVLKSTTQIIDNQNPQFMSEKFRRVFNL